MSKETYSAYGDESIEALDSFHQSVGRAITTFSNMESGLSMLFSCLLAPCDLKKIRICFSYIANFDARLTVIDSISKECYSDSISGPVGNFVRRARELGRMRNKIAHWTVGRIGVDDFFVDLDTGVTVGMYPPLFFKNNLDFEPNLILYQESLTEFIRECAQLTFEIFDFTKVIAGAEK